MTPQEQSAFDQMREERDAMANMLEELCSLVDETVETPELQQVKSIVSGAMAQVREKSKQAEFLAARDRRVGAERAAKELSIWGGDAEFMVQKRIAELDAEANG